MNYEDLAKIVGKKAGAIRVAFSRQGWSITEPEHISAYLEFVRRPTRYTAPRPASCAAHLANYRFRSATIQRLLPALSEAHRRPDTRDLTNWLRRPRYLGTATRLLPEARAALRELTAGLLTTSYDLIGLILTAPQMTEAPAGMLGVIGIYTSLPANAELAQVAAEVAELQSDGLGCPVRYLPTDLSRLSDTLGNPASETLSEWLRSGRVEYGFVALPV